MSIIDMNGFCRKAEENHVLGVVVQQHGQEIARQLWDAARRRDVYSVSKSFTSVAVGIAQKEGLLSLDEKLTDAVNNGTMSDEDLDTVRSLYRDAQFYWDFVFVENSEGVHNSALTKETLDKAEELVDQALAKF